MAFSLFKGKRAQVPGRWHPQSPAAFTRSTEHLSQAGGRTRHHELCHHQASLPHQQAALTPNTKSHQQAPKPLQREVPSSHPAFWEPGTLRWPRRGRKQLPGGRADGLHHASSSPGALEVRLGPAPRWL